MSKLLGLAVLVDGLAKVQVHFQQIFKLMKSWLLLTHCEVGVGHEEHVRLLDFPRPTLVYSLGQINIRRQQEGIGYFGYLKRVGGALRATHRILGRIAANNQTKKCVLKSIE